MPTGEAYARTMQKTALGMKRLLDRFGGFFSIAITKEGGKHAHRIVERAPGNAECGQIGRQSNSLQLTRWQSRAMKALLPGLRQTTPAVKLAL